VARLKTDVFRDRVQLDERRKRELAAIRAKAKSDTAAAKRELATLRDALGALDAVEVGTVIDLMLSYRALGDWDGMIAVHNQMPIALQRQILVREQLAFAYNRRAGASGNAADRDEALRILNEVEAQQGASSETCGLIGRIFKDRWEAAKMGDDAIAAAGYLTRAIDAYVRGFEADPRDAYPGINAVTLLEIKGGADALALKERLLPVVRYAVERRLAGAQPDYWDHATMMELAVLAGDQARAEQHMVSAVALLREKWEAGTTSRNLGLIADARRGRGEDPSWLDDIVRDLMSRSG
jgi:tetratricopeptide (TPR) repeat protein